MEESTPTEQPTCTFCSEAIDNEAIYCASCGYPENGTEKDVAKFFGRRAMQKNKNIDAKDKIKSARNTLYIIAGATLLLGLFVYFQDKDIYALAANFVVFFIFLLLASWTDTKPLMALLLGLLLYLTLVIISAIVDPTTLFSGVIWKVLIITFLGRGIYSASSIKDVKAPNTTKE